MLNRIRSEPAFAFSEGQLHPAEKAEQMYASTQSAQIQGQTGYIGYLRANMSSNGRDFFSSWVVAREDLKTEEFEAEFDSVMYGLRFDPTCGNMLKDGRHLATYCHTHPAARMAGIDEDYCFRVDTVNYSYFLRLNLNKGFCSFYCYCYRKDWLNQH